MEEISQYGHYSLNQTEDQYNLDLAQWSSDCKSLLSAISNLMSPEIRQKLEILWQKQQELTERLTVEGDDEKRERMVKAYESASDLGNFWAIAQLGRIFK